MEDILAQCYKDKENIPLVITVYTDGGPEHKSNFLYVRIAFMALQKSNDADMIVVVRTAPGHFLETLLRM